MSGEIEIKEVKPQPILYVNTVTSYAEISESMGEAFEKVLGYLMEKGIQNGAPFARYDDVSDENAWKIAIGFTLNEPVEGKGEIVGGKLAPGKSAVMMHIGPYEKLHESWNVLHTWVRESDDVEINFIGAVELYLTDPEMESDPNKWKTQLIQPVK
jgi:effector-binding domain-containing protein